jgi:hypothetical protein
MPHRTSLIAHLFALAGLVACTGATSHSVTSPLAPAVLATTFRGSDDAALRAESPCEDCDAVPMSPELARAIEARIADLRSRGGACAQYGAVLDRSYRSGRITIRPFMWRVGTHLTSGEAKPNGDMTLALEIDPLNVGVRTVDDVVRSVEHEAAHITFDLRDGLEGGEDEANRQVRACRLASAPAN